MGYRRIAALLNLGGVAAPHGGTWQSDRYTESGAWLHRNRFSTFCLLGTGLEVEEEVSSFRYSFPCKDAPTGPKACQDGDGRCQGSDGGERRKR